VVTTVAVLTQTRTQYQNTVHPSLLLILLFLSLPHHCRDIGEAINVVTKAAKCSIVTTYCGHGIGELFHTSPNVPHYPKNKAKGTMQPGHIFTIEPMINLGKGWLPCELCYCVSILVVGLNTLAVQIWHVASV
jgi:Xaa-Pro aminopeptidase